MKKYFIAGLLCFPVLAYAVINATGTTYTSGDLETCADGSVSTNCSTERKPVSISCTAPTTRTDSSALPSSEISHHIIQAKDTTNDNQIVKQVSACGSISAVLNAGSWNVRIKTVDTVGRVSDWSNTVSIVITP